MAFGTISSFASSGGHGEESAAGSQVDTGTLNSYCRSCHVKEELPTKNQPGLLEVCPRLGGNFTGEYAVDDGPDTVTIDQLADVYGPVEFDHVGHAKWCELGNGCVDCHHVDTGGITSCGECHEASPVRKDMTVPSLKAVYHLNCMGCHLDWGHENACRYCHGIAGKDADKGSLPDKKVAAQNTYVYKSGHEGGVVTFDHKDHMGMYEGQCTACHAGESCKSCHDVAVQAIAEPASLDFGVTCGSCHDGNVDQIGAFKHASTGLELSENHVELECSDCHTDRNFIVKSCVDCHEDELSYPDDLPGEKAH